VIAKKVGGRWGPIRRAVVFSSAVLGLSLSACSSETPGVGALEEGEALPNRFAADEYPDAFAANWENAEQVYQGTCAYCHNVPTIAPQILGRSLPPEVITTYVRNGQNGMPAFPTTHISDGQLAELAEYIQSSEAPPMPPVHGGPGQ